MSLRPRRLSEHEIRLNQMLGFKVTRIAELEASLASAMGKQNAMDAELQLSRTQFAAVEADRLELREELQRYRAELKLAREALEKISHYSHTSYCDTQTGTRTLPCDCPRGITLQALAALKERE